MGATDKVSLLVGFNQLEKENADLKVKVELLQETIKDYLCESDQDTAAHDMWRALTGQDMPEIEQLQADLKDMEEGFDEAQDYIVEYLGKIELLQAVMDAADAFLAQPPEDMPDDRPFSQYTTAKDCRALNKAYHKVVVAEGDEQ